jgi:hypothetical protein
MTPVSIETYKSLKKQFSGPHPKGHKSVHPLKMSEEYHFQLMNANTTPVQMRCIVWMDNYFRSIGDQNPTRDEIHLDAGEKKQIYGVYLNDQRRALYSGEEVYSERSFLRTWETVFSHVKIRQYKAVSGKCGFCAKLTELRAGTHNNDDWKSIGELHALHRVTFMNERRCYYENIRRAVDQPDKYMSIIIDGMNQNHSQIPYLANIKEFPTPLKVHLIGVIEHGQNFVSDSFPSYNVSYIFWFHRECTSLTGV